jgi:hypothetical protein
LRLVVLAIDLPSQMFPFVLTSQPMVRKKHIPIISYYLLLFLASRGGGAASAAVTQTVRLSTAFYSTKQGNNVLQRDKIFYPKNKNAVTQLDTTQIDTSIYISHLNSFKSKTASWLCLWVKHSWI